MSLKTRKTKAFFSIFIIAAAVGGHGCTSAKPKLAPISPEISRSSQEELRQIVSSVEAEPAPVDSVTAVVQEDTPETDKAKRIRQVPLEMNEHVQKWLDYFTEKDRERFKAFLSRGSKYREVVESVLEENGLPHELYYLAMIESGYQNHAVSPAAAAGAWQFIPATGRRYGLQVDRFVDERRDPIRATEAAAKYLKDLYNVFGSWHLALAAYNAGEYRIVNSVVRGRSRNFWKLIDKKVLPRETANYVPKFIAAVMIGEQPERYGFEDFESEKYPDLESVEVPSPIGLHSVAQVTGVPYAELKRVNPHLKNDMTPPDSSTYELWIPAQSAPKVESLRTALASHQLRSNVPVRQYTRAEKRHYHIVRRGETLVSIARKYQLTTSYLKKVNGLRSNRVLAGSKLRVTAKSYHPGAFTRYRVRRGDSLSGIAKKFGISVTKLKKANAIRGNRVYAGQVLQIRSESI